MTTVSTVKRLTRWMRWGLLMDTVLCFFAGLSLFVATEQTDRFSAWTITSSVTAAFIGAAYWGPGVFLTILSARERYWARSRIAVPATTVFGLMNLVATLLHLDRFHTNSPNLYTQLLTYVWLIPYAIGPVTTAALIIFQLREPGGDPPPDATLPNWLRIVLVAQAAVLIGVGAFLFVWPDGATAVWPWALTPLTAQVIAGWLVGIGVGAGHVVWENDWGRVFPAAVSFLMFGLLEVVVLVRYPGSIDWSGLQSRLFLVFMLSAIAVGLYVAIGSRRLSSRQLRGKPASSSAQFEVQN